MSKKLWFEDLAPLPADAKDQLAWLIYRSQCWTFAGNGQIIWLDNNYPDFVDSEGKYRIRDRQSK